MLRLLHIVLALQANQATIAGTVTDAETGEPLWAATVSLSDIGRLAMTDSTGKYRLAEVPAGPQHVTIRLIGYEQRTLHALVPAAGALQINVLLQRQPIPISAIAVKPRIDVRGADARPGTAYRERTATIAAVRNHPLMAEPDAFQVLSGGDVVLMPEAPSGVHIRGGASDQTGFTLDGVPILNPYHSAGLFSAWNADALLEVRLATMTAPPGLGDAMSGVVQGVTRTPGSRLTAQGSFSTTQVRATVDGPLAGAGAGYLLSLRSSYPAIMAPRDESSYLAGESGDLIAKLEVGRLHVLVYDSDNEIATAASADANSAALRNLFEWHSRSVGGHWSQDISFADAELQVWQAASDAQVRWLPEAAATTTLSAARRDRGVLLALTHQSPRATVRAGMRALQRRTSYDVDSDEASSNRRSWHSTTPLTLAFAEYFRRLAEPLELALDASLTHVRGVTYPDLRARLHFQPARQLSLSGAISRAHQFAQSLRNTESLVGNVFPVDLYMEAGDAGVPVARSDAAVASAELRPWAAARITVQGYARTSHGLALVAARTAAPFAAGDVEVGSATSRGMGVDLVISDSRYALVGSYGWQRTRYSYESVGFTPGFAATHSIELGAIVFPSATWSLRAGLAAVAGRHASPAFGAFEWEACNLLDRGCEFAGSPVTRPETLGTQQLPAYLRVDLGARKHWHVDVGGRDASLALFGTITNLFGRRNLLNYAYDLASDERTAIEMRPQSPLVVGIDWRY